MSRKKKTDVVSTTLMPREKLMAHGVESLAVAELLAIVFNTGHGGESVVELANRLLREYGSNALMNVRRITDLQNSTGLPTVKSCQLIACFEIGRRLFSPQPHATEAITIRSPKDVYDCLAEMRTLRKEQLCGLYLNVRNRVIHKETVSIGTITANLVDPKVVLLPAIEHCAVGVIIAHNHPSGNPEPSDEDIAITTQLAKAATILGLKLLDHVIIGDGSFRSLNEMGII